MRKICARIRKKAKGYRMPHYSQCTVPVNGAIANRLRVNRLALKAFEGVEDWTGGRKEDAGQSQTTVRYACA